MRWPSPPRRGAARRDRARTCAQAVALIARHGRVGYFESFGVRDPVSGAPMAKDAIFRIYSMTKPITSVAAMMLWEEGRFLLSDSIADYLPEFSHLQVAVVRDGAVERVPADRAITIQDLLRHTAGLTYEFRGSGPVHKMYMSAKVYSRSQTSADQVATLAKTPLLHQPGTQWEYSRATDVVGRLIEVLSGVPLRVFFERRIFAPLGMSDTAFHVPPQHHPRILGGFHVTVAQDHGNGEQYRQRKCSQRAGLGDLGA